MNKDKVKTILGSAIQSDNSLYCCGTYIAWSGKELTLDGDFDLEYLQAVVWWLENQKNTNQDKTVFIANPPCIIANDIYDCGQGMGETFIKGIEDKLNEN